MKAKVINEKLEKEKEIELPEIFTTNVREDIILKVWEATKRAQPYGAYLLAGKESSASGKFRHRRHKHKTLYGYGISRVPRKILTQRGERFYWQGAFIPGTVGGRRAHPPKPIKRKKKINKKEKEIAIKSCIASTALAEYFKKKYNREPNMDLPLVISSSILEKKNKEIKEIIEKIAERFGLEIEKKQKRSGRGKRRRGYVKRVKKILFVMSSEEKRKKKKIGYGIETIEARNLGVKHIATGGVPARLVIYTEKAIEELKKRFEEKTKKEEKEKIEKKKQTKIKNDN